MSGKTKYSIAVEFDKKVPLSHVASSKLQKEKNVQKTTRTLGSTKPSASFEPPVLHWDEVTDPIAKTVALAIKEVSATVTFSVKIWVDQSVDKKCDCYAHVLDHEKRHAGIWQSGAKKRGKDILKAICDATTPTMAKPVTVKQSEVKKLRAAAFKKIEAALEVAVKAAGEAISKESKKIHTAAELKKTNALCVKYLSW
ncbi:MAG: hypothetical protein ACI8R4_001039 [Paracoccaceae bacterium]|jgi:hypothetical protein